MKHTKTEKHEFAIYVDTLSKLMKNSLEKDRITIIDEPIVHRLTTVLRINVGDTCVFFDRSLHMQVTIKDIIKQKQLVCSVVSQNNNRIQKPHITFLLPILKRDDLEAALYSLTEIGVTTIQLIATHKMHRMAFGRKEMERAQRIIIAAAEQSKNFAYPELKEIVSLSQACEIYKNSTKIFFDAQGDSLFTTVQLLGNTHSQDITLLVGPEGDLSCEEKEIAAAEKFMKCALTSTVLRSVQAIALSAGMVRSLLT